MGVSDFVKFGGLILKIDVIRGINGIFCLVFINLASCWCNFTRNDTAVLLDDQSDQNNQFQSNIARVNFVTI